MSMCLFHISVAKQTTKQVYIHMRGMTLDQVHHSTETCCTENKINCRNITDLYGKHSEKNVVIMQQTLT